MSEKVVQLYDKDGNNIFPVTSFEAMSGSETLNNTFVQKSGDVMTGNLKVPNLDIANDICRGYIYGETNSLNFRGGNPTTEKYTYLKIAEDGVYIDNQKIYYPGNKPTPDEIGAAPAGYGLGKDAKFISNTDIDTLFDSGFYTIGAGCTNVPTGTDQRWSGLFVMGGRACTQIYRPANHESSYYGTFTSLLIRIYKDGTGWGPWEWINPPMFIGTEYRTTERYQGNPVYKKMDSNGVIWWSTNQSTWKRESERAGAMPKLYYGRLLDGIPNTNNANNRISGAGWYRILRTVGNESYLIHLGHGYNSGGPEDMLFKVCIDRYCPSIVVLSNSVYRNTNFYTKIRITYDNTYSYVDFYYARDEANAVLSTIWAFDKNGGGVRAESLQLSKVNDAPSGETISLTQDVSIISSGNVLTVGADNILPISKGGTGGNNVKNARANLGIDKIVTCPAGRSISLTLPNNSIYLIGTSDNVRTNGLILVYTNGISGHGNIQRVTQLSNPNSWSYSLANGVLTLSETDGRYPADFSIVTLCSGANMGVYS